MDQFASRGTVCSLSQTTESHVGKSWRVTYDCIKILEYLLSRLVSVLETAHMEDKVLIDSTIFTAHSIEAAAFQQA